MIPHYRGNPRSSHAELQNSDTRKEKVNAILAALDDDALMLLAVKLRDIGLLNSLPLQMPHMATSMPQIPPAINLNASLPQAPPMALPVGALPSWQACSDTSISGPTMQAVPLPVGALPLGTGFSSIQQHPSVFTPPIPAPSVSPRAVDLKSHPPGNWALSSSGMDSGQTNAQDIGEGDDEHKFPDQSCTTLILRNFPGTFDQDKARQFVDEHGYEDKYDFFLWFPAKATSRLNGCGYAFVNFRFVGDAQRFLKEQQNAPFQDNDGSDNLPLSIAIAKIQGFAKNYTRFHPLLEGNAQTMCSPYFAKDSLEALHQAEAEASTIAHASIAVTPMSIDNTERATTIIFRNLPDTVENTELAKEWLDEAGYAAQYDFVLYLPAKKTRRPGYHGRGYAFVNFKEQRNAFACMQALQGKTAEGCEIALNIVAAKIQGKTECVRHFSSLIDGGRVTPWTEPLGPRTSFQ